MWTRYCWLFLLLSCDSIYSNEFKITEQQAYDATVKSSELMILIKSRLKILFEKIYETNENNQSNRYLVYYSGKGGMGNQLLGLASAVIGAACSGRRLLIDPHKPESIASWLWNTDRGFFEPPFESWQKRNFHRRRLMKEEESEKEIRRSLRGSSFHSALTIELFLRTMRNSHQKVIAVCPHHKALLILWRTDKGFHDWFLNSLASVEKEEAIHPDQSSSSTLSSISITYEDKIKSLSKKEILKQFSFEIVSKLPQLWDVIASALSALQWKPTVAFQKAIDHHQTKWYKGSTNHTNQALIQHHHHHHHRPQRGGGNFPPNRIIALQVRACLDCGWVMSDALIRLDTRCDIMSFKQIQQEEDEELKNLAVSQEKTKNERTRKGVLIDSRTFTALRNHSNGAVSKEDEPLIVYVTTESQNAGDIIAQEIEHLSSSSSSKRPIIITSSSSFEFLHTSHHVDIKDSFQQRLSPVLDWWLFGGFDYVASCGTSYTQTAIGRRNSLPRSVILHSHHANDTFQEQDDLNRMAMNQSLPDLKFTHHDSVLESSNIFPADWRGCPSAELFGSRFIKH